MTIALLVVIAVLAVASCLIGALAYALRDFSRTRLEEVLQSQGRPERLQPLLDHRRDFVLLAASLRLVAVLAILGTAIRAFDQFEMADWARQASAFALAAVISVLFGVGLASSLAAYFGESIIARLDGLLHGLRAFCLPVLWVMNRMDDLVFRVSPHASMDADEQAEKQVEGDVLAVVEEGVKEGVVDETDREMIESVIQFRDTTAGQIMTARPSIVALEDRARLDEAAEVVDRSGHSRVPVYERDLDHIVGILYARDLLNQLADATLRRNFDIKKVMRKPLFVPETKPLKDLLLEFRLRKVHLAIVLDEFGGTAGLITIEDVLEELVGEISDEHEPSGPPPVAKLSDDTWEVDARTYVDEVNSVIGLSIPEDQGYDTLGGYVSSVLGRIPEKGEEFETTAAKWTVVDAEPTRVVRLRIALIPPDATVTGGSDRPDGQRSEG
jgi:putative hemolysin